MRKNKQVNETSQMEKLDGGQTVMLFTVILKILDSDTFLYIFLFDSGVKSTLDRCWVS